MGGRIVATAHGPAALLMYDDHGLRLVMLMRPMSREQNMPMARYAEGALNGYSWAAKGLTSPGRSRGARCACIPSPTKYAGKSRAPSDSTSWDHSIEHSTADAASELEARARRLSSTLTLLGL